MADTVLYGICFETEFRTQFAFYDKGNEICTMHVVTNEQKFDGQYYLELDMRTKRIKKKSSVLLLAGRILHRLVAKHVLASIASTLCTYDEFVRNESRLLMKARMAYDVRKEAEERQKYEATNSFEEGVTSPSKSEDDMDENVSRSALNQVVIDESIEDGSDKEIEDLSDVDANVSHSSLYQGVIDEPMENDPDQKTPKGASAHRLAKSVSDVQEALLQGRRELREHLSRDDQNEKLLEVVRTVWQIVSEALSIPRHMTTIEFRLLVKGTLWDLEEALSVWVNLPDR